MVNKGSGECWKMTKRQTDGQWSMNAMTLGLDWRIFRVAGEGEREREVLQLESCWSQLGKCVVSVICIPTNDNGTSQSCLALMHMHAMTYHFQSNSECVSSIIIYDIEQYGKEISPFNCVNTICMIQLHCNKQMLHNTTTHTPSCCEWCPPCPAGVIFHFLPACACTNLLFNFVLIWFPNIFILVHGGVISYIRARLGQGRGRERTSFMKRKCWMQTDKLVER